MPKRQLKRIAHSIIPHAVVGHLSPTTCRQTNVRPVQIREKRAVATRLPAENIEVAAGGDGALRHPDIAARCPYLRRNRPSRCVTFVETKDAANFFVNLQFAKVRRLFGPLHIPGDATNEILFMNAIPRGSPDLDK